MLWGKSEKIYENKLAIEEKNVMITYVWWKNSNGDITQKVILWQITTTKSVTKLTNSNSYKPQHIKLWKNQL